MFLSSHSFADELEGKGLICDDITAAGSLSYGFGFNFKKNGIYKKYAIARYGDELSVGNYAEQLYLTDATTITLLNFIGNINAYIDRKTLKLTYDKGYDAKATCKVIQDGTLLLKLNEKAKIEQKLYDAQRKENKI